MTTTVLIPNICYQPRFPSNYYSIEASSSEVSEISSPFTGDSASGSMHGSRSSGELPPFLLHASSRQSETGGESYRHAAGVLEGCFSAAAAAGAAPTSATSSPPSPSPAAVVFSFQLFGKTVCGIDPTSSGDGLPTSDACNAAQGGLSSVRSINSSLTTEPPRPRAAAAPAATTASFASAAAAASPPASFQSIADLLLVDAAVAAAAAAHGVPYSASSAHPASSAADLADLMILSASKTQNQLPVLPPPLPPQQQQQLSAALLDLLQLQSTGVAPSSAMPMMPGDFLCGSSKPSRIGSFLRDVLEAATGSTHEALFEFASSSQATAAAAAAGMSASLPWSLLANGLEGTAAPSNPTDLLPAAAAAPAGLMSSAGPTLSELSNASAPTYSSAATAAAAASAVGPAAGTSILNLNAMDYSASALGSPSRTPWTKEEDAELRRLIALHGTTRWSVIAAKLGSKDNKQCRRRWQAFLNASGNKGVWTADEDSRLLQGHRMYGNRWTEIAKLVPGRTDNAVKNRYAALVNRRLKSSRSASGKGQSRSPGVDDSSSEAEAEESLSLSSDNLASPSHLVPSSGGASIGFHALESTGRKRSAVEAMASPGKRFQRGSEVEHGARVALFDGGRARHMMLDLNLEMDGEALQKN